METQRQRLYRSQTNRVFAGICGGMAEYFHADATLIRLAWVILTFLGGSGIIFYIIAYFIIPLKPGTSGDVSQPPPQSFAPARAFGILFVLVGVVILLDNLDIISFHRWWHLSWEFAFPAFLIFAGLYFLARRAAAPHPTPEHPAGQDSSNQIPSSASEEKPQARVLHRSRKDKKIFGICAGLGEYFVIDPTIVRVVYVLFTLLTGGLGIVLYFLLYLIIPDDRSLPGVQE